MESVMNEQIHAFALGVAAAVFFSFVFIACSGNTSTTGKVIFKCTQSNTCDGASTGTITIPDVCDDQSKAADDESKAASGACIPTGNPDGGECSAKACSATCTKTNTPCQQT